MFRSGPRVFRQFASTLTGAEQFPKLRVINLTGAPAHRGDVDLYKKHFSTGCLLVNTLGTHEVGPFRMYVIGSNTKITEEVIPVGYEIQDKEVLLLDDNGQDVGFNRPGEIAVKSRHLSPGYWRRPDLTKTKFLEDPSGGDRRIYLTGDLGTMSPDAASLSLEGDAYANLGYSLATVDNSGDGHQGSQKPKPAHKEIGLPPPQIQNCNCDSQHNNCTSCNYPNGEVMCGDRVEDR